MAKKIVQITVPVTNLLDYLRWRGDLSFSTSPFNEADALVLARLSYLPFDGIVSSEFDSAILLRDVAECFLEKENAKELVLWPQDYDFMIALRDSRRFRGAQLCGFVNRIDEDVEKQFCAVTIKYDERAYYISYRGTDNTLIGWKEDFNMVYMTTIPSQLEAVEYLENVYATFGSGHYVTGGHSKGGNLAIYAASMCCCDVQACIEGAYNFDGPGFRRNVLDSDGYMRIIEKIHTYVPQSSVVGLLLDHEEQFTVTKSVQSGFMQHDIYSWEVVGTELSRADALTRSSRWLDASLKEWLVKMDYEGRERFINSVYAVIRKSQAKTMDAFVSAWNKNVIKLLATLKKFDKEDRKNVERAMFLLLQIFIKNYVSGIIPFVEKKNAEKKKRA